MSLNVFFVLLDPREARLFTSSAGISVLRNRSMTRESSMLRNSSMTKESGMLRNSSMTRESKISGRAAWPGWQHA
jgi:hypothetical protein